MRDGRGHTRVCNSVLLSVLHSTLGFGEPRRGNHFHGLTHDNKSLYISNAEKSLLTLVIFSIFRTDFKRSSSSRRVAMLRALWGGAPKWEGCATRRATDRLDNIELTVNSKEREGLYAFYTSLTSARAGNSRSELRWRDFELRYKTFGDCLEQSLTSLTR